ncbi:Fibronectin-binding lipoprotein (plasmid) [Borrelia nietonii YOR]|uniref:Fibronectin-binding lipoprotein n=1 Tax=Borrelia nietonii YOR TaxID=1293576 RepID=W5SAE8_9SPIR|nr:Fibronectin-binding lipoprotein [Borrelia nietonii YOR]
MQSKTQYLGLSFLLSFISCVLIFNGKLKDKSVNLLHIED